MGLIHIKMLTEDALQHFKQNVEIITKKIIENDDNEWIYDEFPKPIFVEKKCQINDFELVDNPKSADKEIDFDNSIKLYENLKGLPRYILCDERFWLWLHLEKFYGVVKGMTIFKGKTTVENMWLHSQGARRSIMFGILSRMFFRVALTVDERVEDKYDLTRWVIENPLRYRELSWRTYSSQEHLVRGIVRGERRAVNDYGGEEKTAVYKVVPKKVSLLGSVRLLDAFSEEDIEKAAYDITSELLRK